jgi:hypothetical protein
MDTQGQRQLALNMDQGLRRDELHDSPRRQPVQVDAPRHERVLVLPQRRHDCLKPPERLPRVDDCGNAARFEDPRRLIHKNRSVTLV